MRDYPEQLIRTVHRGVESSLRTKDPIAAAGRYLERLRAEGEWRYKRSLPYQTCSFPHNCLDGEALANLVSAWFTGNFWFAFRP